MSVKIIHKEELTCDRCGGVGERDMDGPFMCGGLHARDMIIWGTIGLFNTEGTLTECPDPNINVKPDMDLCHSCTGKFSEWLNQYTRNNGDDL